MKTLSTAQNRYIMPKKSLIAHIDCVLLLYEQSNIMCRL